MSPKYFDVVIHQNTFHIVESAYKPYRSNSAQKTLKKIEFIVKNKLSYLNAQEDKYSKGFDSFDLYKLLNAKSAEIARGYNEKLSKVHSIIRFIFGRKKIVNQLENRIGNYITPPRVLNLPSDPITVILSKLPLADLSRVAQLNRHGQLLVNRQIKERARRYGYEGKDFEESKNYLKDLKREFNNFLRAQFNSSLSLDEKVEILFQKDASELLDLLRLVAGHSSALLQLFTVVLKEKFKNNPAQDINKKDAYGSGLLFLITCNRAISCSDRFTASHLERRKKLVSLLLKYGADPLDRNINNYTAFHYAAINRETELLRLFLQSGTPIESPSIWQHTALAHAAYYGHVETVKLLLEHKASPNIANVNRTTSLHTTVYSPFGRLEIGKLEIVKLLLDHGADLFARDINGKTAYDLAEDYLRDYLYQRMHSDKTA